MEVPKQKQQTRLHVLQGIAIVPCDAFPTQQQWQSWRFIRDPLYYNYHDSGRDQESCKEDFSVPKVAGRVAE